LRVAEEAAPILNQSVISDVVVGAMLAQAALDSAAINVEINLAAMADPAEAERLGRELEQARAGASDRLQRVVEAGRSRFPRRKS
jgi:formiminotetrahydrofolate cyclodeaminase